MRKIELRVVTVVVFRAVVFSRKGGIGVWADLTSVAVRVQRNA